MKVIACFLFACLSTLSVAQTGAHDGAVDGLTAVADRGKELHDRSLNIVQAERARAKQPLCPKAMSTLDVNECYNAELGTTEANYTKLVRTLGALLRSGEETTPPKRIPFDDAETAWHSYRELACHADGAQYEGGTIRPSIEMGCALTLTRHHMDELWDLYSDLGTQ